MNFQPPTAWGDASSHWSPPNFSSQTSSHGYPQSPSSSQPVSGSYDPYVHFARDYSSSFSQQRDLSTVSPHAQPHYPHMNPYAQEMSSTSSVANNSLQRLPPQVAAFPEASQSQLHEESNMASTADIVHAYRRLSGEEEQLSESTFGEQSSSSRKKSGSHNPSRQQLPAKFECVACHARFSYESSAKRHQLNQVKRFRCNVCNQKFARVDYRNWHQRRCESGFRLSVLDQSPG